jgi:hypothetical protein
MIVSRLSRTGTFKNDVSTDGERPIQRRPTPEQLRRNFSRKRTTKPEPNIHHKEIGNDRRLKFPFRFSDRRLRAAQQKRRVA